MGKKKKWSKKLLEDYEKGKILQVDNDVDNKEYLKSREDPNGITEIQKIIDEVNSDY